MGARGNVLINSRMWFPSGKKQRVRQIAALRKCPRRRARAVAIAPPFKLSIVYFGEYSGTGHVQ